MNKFIDFLADAAMLVGFCIVGICISAVFMLTAVIVVKLLGASYWERLV